MRTRRENRWLAIALAAAFAACGGSDGGTDPGGGNGGGGGDGGGGGGGGGGGDPVPAAIVSVSGGGQSTGTLERASQPLVVRVEDADGVGVSAVTVNWSVDGPGTLSSATSTTNSQGQASVSFTGGQTLGTSTVSATVSGVSGGVDFTVDTDVFVIRMLGIAYVAPAGGDDATVPVGTTVRWVNDDGVSHTVTSSEEPGGGSPMDSGTIGIGDSFSFTPTVEGTWTYFCEVHPGIMVGATLTATS